MPPPAAVAGNPANVRIVGGVTTVHVSVTGVLSSETANGALNEDE